MSLKRYINFILEKKSPEIFFDLLAYSSDGKRAIAIFDTAQPERDFVFVFFRKDREDWKNVKEETRSGMDGIDAMSHANHFLNEAPQFFPEM